MSLLAQLLTFAGTLVVFMAISRWINRQVQNIGLRVSNSSAVAVMLYYLLMFPGILLHELSHFLSARLLGMKVGKFTVGPRRRQNAVELGSVTVTSGGAVRDSLVGLAPFLFGTAVLLLVSYQVFDVATLALAWEQGGWHGVFRALDGIWLVPDFWLWAYIIFVVSNAMTPSPADRQPWLVAGIYLGLATLIIWLLGGLPIVTAALRAQAMAALRSLTLAFMFTAAINLAVAGLLWVIETAIIGLQQS
ncbi:MAG: hypothetical protein ACUVR4_08030 [Anaerolineae bacterium]